jgi:phospholipid N-methyltransferase
MLLHFNTIPASIQKCIYKEIDNDFNVCTQLINLVQMERILEGTSWNTSTKKGNSAPKSYDVFSTLNLDEISKEPATKKLNTLF